MTPRDLFVITLRVWGILALLGDAEWLMHRVAYLASGPVSPASLGAVFARTSPFAGWPGVLLTGILAVVVLIFARQIANWFYGRKRTSPEQDEPLRIEAGDLLRVGVQFLGLYALLLGLLPSLSGYFASRFYSPWQTEDLWLLRSILYFIAGLAMILIPHYLARKDEPREPPAPGEDFRLRH